ncbi:MAG: SdpI family protein [Thermoanaerobaculia bacterium]|nr:SdpI family protein [Thermoanaerobaculia bacterium]
MVETEEFLVLAGGLALVCSPLAMGWVKPNYFYGVRTRATLASAELWRRVNRFFGRVGLLAAAILVVLSRFAPIETSSAWVPLVVLLSPLACAVWLTVVYQRQIQRELAQTAD